MRVAGSMAACQESVGTRHASLRATAPENLTRRFSVLGMRSHERGSY